jgi:hypothetical protein
MKEEDRDYSYAVVRALDEETRQKMAEKEKEEEQAQKMLVTT